MAAIAARAAEAAAVADEDEFAAPPRPAEVEALAGLSDPSVADWETSRVADLALTVERTALASDPRLVGVEQAVYADAAERVAIASSTGVAGEYESSSCFAYLQALAEGEGGAGDRPRLRPRPRARAASTPRRSAREGGGAGGWR